MLILRRKIDERIHIGPDVVVVVTGLRRGSVSLGVEAPRSIEVHRGEIFDAIRLQEKESEGIGK
jgi:carbon storage regulator